MKLIVIGYSGAGKTVLTNALAQQLGCPVMHVDELLFTRNFDPRDSAEATETVEEILRENTSWIMDGYKKAFTKRAWLEAADYIVFLNFNRVVCFWRAVKRTFRRAAHDFSSRKEPAVPAEPEAARTEAAPASDTIWKPSKFYSSLHWILVEERRLGHYSNVGELFPDKFIVLRSQGAVNRFAGRLLEEAKG